MGYKISCSKGAEVSRMILAHAGISYEDYRVPQEDWPAMKPSKYQFQNKCPFTKTFLLYSYSKWYAPSFGIQWNYNHSIINYWKILSKAVSFGWPKSYGRGSS